LEPLELADETQNSDVDTLKDLLPLSIGRLRKSAKYLRNSVGHFPYYLSL
jgi:hypothetical protein